MISNQALIKSKKSDFYCQKDDDFPDRARRYVRRLRFQFLTPIVVTLTFAVMVIISIVYFHEHRMIDSDIIQLQTTANKLYQSSTKLNARALQSLMDVLKRDDELISALAKRDHQKLLQRAAPIYKDLNQHYKITHFYFSDPDRVNLLRVHKPEKFGDIINRQTTLSAKKSGVDAYGIELGPLGTLTLRYVQPWYDKQTQALLGFVELGMEVDQTVDSIRSMFGTDTFILIKKQFLNQEGWQEGIKTFGGNSNWNLFKQLVVSLHGSQFLPENLINLIGEIDFNQHLKVFQKSLDSDLQYAIFLPLEDVSGSPVGVMVMVFDTSTLAEQAQESVIIGSVTVVLSAIILTVFFYWFVGRIGVRMAKNEFKLQQMATHDSLTGLFNRRQFNLMLHDSIAHHSRYNRSVSLLMIDIDHFKKVNDTYGHLAGDQVLISLAKHLLLHTREIDRVCRFGGEEFVILLPEADAKNATIFAQRLCNSIASDLLINDHGTELRITVSIGVATYQENVGGGQELIDAADKALYTAKETGRNRVYSYGDIHSDKV